MASIFLASCHDVWFARTSLGAQFKQTELITFAADVATLLEQGGAERISYIDAPPHGAADLAHCQIEADRVARAFDRQLAELRERHLGYGFGSPGWDYHNTYHIALSLLRWSRYVPQLAAAVEPRRALAYFTLGNAQDLYFDSALQRHFLRAALAAGGHGTLQAFANPGAGAFVPAAASFRLELDRLDGARPSALVHLPAFDGDVAALRQRLAAAHGQHWTDIASPYFDLPLAAQRVALAPALAARASNPDQQRYLDAVRAASLALFDWLCPEAPAIAAQVERQVARALSQLQAFEQLCNAPELAGVGAVHLSDFDAGLSGPLHSWAVCNGLELDIHPHQQAAVTPFPAAPKARRHGYARAPDTFTELGIARGQWSACRLPAVFRPCQRAPRVLLLVNTVQDHAGLPTCSLAALAGVLAAALALCRARAVPCQIGLAGGTRIALALARQLAACGVEDDPATLFAAGGVAEWAASASMCVGFDQPATALLSFINAGVACIHAHQRALGDGERHALPEQNVILSDYNGAIEQLKRMLSTEQAVN